VYYLTAADALKLQNTVYLVLDEKRSKSSSRVQTSVGEILHKALGEVQE